MVLVTIRRELLCLIDILLSEDVGLRWRGVWCVGV